MNLQASLKFDSAALDTVFAELDNSHWPGAAVGIAHHGSPRYRKAFGLANMEQPLGLTPATRMRIYSTTKHFTCLAYLLLCEEGRVGLDDPIGTFLPELPPVMRDVTAHQLMSHVGGLRDAHAMIWQFSGTGRAIRTADILDFYQSLSDINFAPGTRWCYNNGGYALLSIAIERIAGIKLEAVFKERIFDPIGMHDSLLRRVDTDFVPNSATMHMGSRVDGFRKSYLGSETAGEGGIVSTVDDMLRWLAHMRSPWVGSRASWAMLREPHRLPNGVSTDYGLGLITGTYRGLDILYHAGGGLGASCQMLTAPQLGLDIVILSNRHDVLAPVLADRVLDMCVTGLDPVPTNAGAGPLIKGVYAAASGRVIEMTAAKGTQIAMIDGWPIPMASNGLGQLRMAISSQFRKEIRTVPDQSRPGQIQLDEFGVVEAFDRIDSDPPEKGQTSDLVGGFMCETADIRADLRLDGDRGTLNVSGTYGALSYSLRHLAGGCWLATSTQALPDAGTIMVALGGSGFTFFSSVTWGLRFKRIEAPASLSGSSAR